MTNSIEDFARKESRRQTLAIVYIFVGIMIFGALYITANYPLESVVVSAVATKEHTYDPESKQLSFLAKLPSGETVFAISKGNHSIVPGQNIKLNRQKNILGQFNYQLISSH